MGGDVFPILHQRGERIRSRGGDEGVDVVGHDDKRIERIPVFHSIATVEHLNDDLPCGGFPQWTCAVARIQKALDSGREQPMEFTGRLLIVRVRMREQPFIAVRLPGREHIRRDGIFEAKCDEVNAAILPPVREVAPPCPADGLAEVEPAIVPAEAGPGGRVWVLVVVGLPAVHARVFREQGTAASRELTGISTPAS